MTTYAKPSVLPAWGETNTTAADMVQPASATIDTGFPLSSTPPARQTFNWLFNFCTSAVRYFCQRGMADYDADETYGLNARVIGDDGNTYVSLQAANSGNTPSTSAAWWARWGHTAAEIATLITTYSYATAAWVENYVAGLAYATTAWVQANFASLASPAFTGTPTAPTPAAADDSTRIATTAWSLLGLQFSLSAAGGWIAFPRWLTGGTERFVVKYGVGVGNGTAVVFDATVPFASEPAIFTTCNGASSYFTNPSAAGCTVVSQNSSAPLVNWFAIGNSAN
jgi:hypothetical protein